MGKATPTLNTSPNGTIAGYMVVGNAQCRMSGRKIGGNDIKGSVYTITDMYPKSVKEDQMDNILDGEIATWAELIKSDILDLWAWPDHLTLPSIFGYL